MYLMGEGVEQDDKQAAFWYEKAAAKGSEPARRNLANLRKVESDSDNKVGEILPGEQQADNEEKPEQEKKSRFAFIKNIFSKDKDKEQEQDSSTAAEAGSQPEDTTDEAVTEQVNAEPEEEHKSFFGRLFGKDKEEEKEQAEAADEQEDQTITPEQEKEVSEFIKSQDDDKQVQTDTNSAKNDYDKGLKYQYGEGVQKDNSTAFQLFMSSARQGYAPAQYKLGTAYAYGEGVDKDEYEAARWYNRAARQGYAIAQRNLGVMYLNGEGVEKSKPMAMAWYSILADAGNVMDIRRRDMLDEELSPQEKEEARQFKDQIIADINMNKK